MTILRFFQNISLKFEQQMTYTKLIFHLLRMKGYAEELFLHSLTYLTIIQFQTLKFKNFTLHPDPLLRKCKLLKNN